MSEHTIGQVAGWQLAPVMREKLMKEERERDEPRRKRVAAIRKAAGEGNPLAITYAFRLTNRDPHHQDKVLAEFAATVNRAMASVREAYPAIRESVGRNTGMTLEDFLWLRDYDSSRRADGLGPEGEGDTHGLGSI